MAATVAALEASVFVGVDWAKDDHAVCVVDASGRRVASFTVGHSRDGFEGLTRRLAAVGPVGEVPVGIERPDGRLVDALLEAGHPVVAVSPNAIKACRESEVVSGAKDDATDANVIAEYVRLKAHQLTVVSPFSTHTRALRAVVRTRSDLVRQRVAAHNQLEACLDAFWPGAKAVFADVASEIALAFLQRYPTPASARRLGEQRMQAFLTKHGYSGRRPAAQLVARLRAAPPGILDGPEPEADRSVAAHLGEHPGAEIFTSLPRSGRINAAQVLAEWGDSRQAYDGPQAVAALAGIAPVTEKSRKHHAVGFRWACNKRLRNAITTFADNSRHASPWAAHIYQQAVARGCDHPHAIRVLARAWTRVIYRCWLNRQPYNPAHHGAAAKLEEATTNQLAA